MLISGRITTMKGRYKIRTIFLRVAKTDGAYCTTLTAQPHMDPFHAGETPIVPIAAAVATPGPCTTPRRRRRKKKPTGPNF